GGDPLQLPLSCPALRDPLGLAESCRASASAGPRKSPRNGAWPSARARRSGRAAAQPTAPPAETYEQPASRRRRGDRAMKTDRGCTRQRARRSPRRAATAPTSKPSQDHRSGRSGESGRWRNGAYTSVASPTRPTWPTDLFFDGRLFDVVQLRELRF